MNRCGLLCAILAAAPGLARGQAPPAGPPAAPAPGPPAAPGMRIVSGQAPVVGGNAAGARERALDEAIRQAVDLALGDIADAPTRAAQAKTVKALLARAKSFVPRYRTLEEGEAGGIYTVRLEAEVDEVALRSKLERTAVPTPPPGRAAPMSVLIVAGDKKEGSAAVAAGLASALSSTGARARVGEETAAVAGQALVRITADLSDEGALRGVGRVSVSCHAAARSIASPSRPPIEQSASARVFAAELEGGRGDCVARLTAELAGRVGSALATGGGASDDLRAVTVDADVIEPAAVPALLRSVRSVGAVSVAELTRVAAGRAEIRLRARAATAALAAALPRNAGTMITLSDVEVSGDVIHLRARLRAAPTPPPAGSNP